MSAALHLRSMPHSHMIHTVSHQQDLRSMRKRHQFQLVVSFNLAHRPLPPRGTNPFADGSYYSLSADDPNAKRRGRPPKVEVERRKREAEARGEEYPTPRASKKPKTDRSSLVPVETAMAGPASALILETVTTPFTNSRVAASPATSSASKKRGRPSKPSDALADPDSATEPQRSYGRLLPDLRNAHRGGPPLAYDGPVSSSP